MSSVGIHYYSGRALLISNFSHILTTKGQGGNRVRCCSDARDAENKILGKSSQTPRILKLAVGGVTELLRFFSAGNEHTYSREKNKSVAVSSVDDILMILKLDYDNSYFVTGNFTSEIYAEDCLFEDPTIRFQGKQLYYRNLKLLVPFLDRQSISLQKLEVSNSESASVLAKWKLRTYLKLPWRPLISIDGSTMYEINEEFQINRHSESWDVSAIEAIGQVFNIHVGRTSSG